MPEGDKRRWRDKIRLGQRVHGGTGSNGFGLGRNPPFCGVLEEDVVTHCFTVYVVAADQCPRPWQCAGEIPPSSDTRVLARSSAHKCAEASGSAQYPRPRISEPRKVLTLINTLTY